MGSWLHHLWFAWFWPSDLGNGPEAIQEAVVVAVATAIVWPPLRKRIHRFADRKLAETEAAARRERDELHRKLDHIIHHHPDIPDLPSRPHSDGS